VKELVGCLPYEAVLYASDRRALVLEEQVPTWFFNADPLEGDSARHRFVAPASSAKNAAGEIGMRGVGRVAFRDVY
jgi:hypothetical protein